jgi:hypothetical protein
MAYVTFAEKNIGQSHPRLQLRTRVQPNNEDQWEQATFLDIFIVGCETQDTLNQVMKSALDELPEIKQLSLELEKHRAHLNTARETNDEFFANEDEPFRIILAEYKREVSLFEKGNKNPSARQKEIRRNLRRAEKITKLRDELNAILSENSSTLPHPIKKSDKTQEVSCGISIEELSEDVRAAKKLLDAELFTSRSNRDTAHLFLVSKFSEFALASNNTAFIQLAELLAKGRLQIYELESGFGEDLRIETDERGLPADARPYPISVELRMVRYAAETGNTVLDEEGNFAIVTATSSLVGSLRNGRAQLVVIERSMVEQILAFEDRWQTQVDLLFSQALQTIDDQSMPQAAIDEEAEVGPANDPLSESDGDESEADEEHLPAFSSPPPSLPPPSTS